MSRGGKQGAAAKAQASARTAAAVPPEPSQDLPPWITRLDATRALLAVVVVPQASITTWAGVHDGKLRIRLAAPPVDGKANDELIRFVAAELGLPRRDIEIRSGQTSKRKTLLIACGASTLFDALAPIAAAD